MENSIIKQGRIWDFKNLKVAILLFAILAESSDPIQNHDSDNFGGDM